MADRRHISPAQRRRLGHSSSLHGDVSRRNFNPMQSSGSVTGGSYPSEGARSDAMREAYAYEDEPRGWDY